MTTYQELTHAFDGLASEETLPCFWKLLTPIQKEALQEVGLGRFSYPRYRRWFLDWKQSPTAYSDFYAYLRNIQDDYETNNGHGDIESDWLDRAEERSQRFQHRLALRVVERVVWHQK